MEEEQPKEEEEALLTRNYLVLEKLLSLLPFSSLKVSRCVSRRWNEVASDLWLHRCSKVMVCFTTSESLCLGWKKHGLEEMNKFTTLVKARGGDTPFTSFDLGSSVLKNEETVEEFFRVTGPHMKTLALRLDDRDGFVVDCPLLSRLKSLRSFKIIVHDTYDASHLNHFLDLGKRVISAALDTLDNLALIVESNDDDAIMACVIPPLLLQCKLPRLELVATLRGPHLRALTELRPSLQLTHLRLDPGNSRLRYPGPMKRFLTSQSSTLESLTLTANYSTDWVVEFPCMSNLRVLELSTPRLWPIAFVFPNFSFVDQFPKLMTLLVAGSQSGIEQILREDVQPSDSVEEVSLKLWSGALQDQGPRLAGACFPNLKRCEVTWNLLPNVYDFLPHLEELTITAYHSGTLIDHLITGVSNEDCAAINEEGSYEDEIHQLPRNITCLKKLEKLSLATHRCYVPAVLTEASFRFALFRMEGLKSLDLGFTPLHVSWDCVEEMRKRFISVRGLNWTPRPSSSS